MSKYYPIVARAVQIVSKNLSNLDQKENNELTKFINEEAKTIYFQLQESEDSATVQSVTNQLTKSVEDKYFHRSGQNSTGSVLNLIEMNSKSESTPIPVRVQREATTNSSKSRILDRSSTVDEVFLRSNVDIIPHNPKSQKILVNVINDRQTSEIVSKKSEKRSKKSRIERDQQETKSHLSRATTIDNVLQLVDRKKNKSSASNSSERLIHLDRSKVKSVKSISTNRPTTKQQKLQTIFVSNSYILPPTIYYQRQPMIYNEQRWFYTTPTTTSYVPTSTSTQYYPLLYYTY